MNFEVSFPTQWDIQPFETLFAEPTRNGLTRPKRVRGNGIKMVNMGEIFAFDRIFNQEMDRVPVTDKEYDKSILKEGDLLFARQSLTLKGAGKCSIVMTDEEMTFESHLIRARLQREKADPLFYYYFFKSKIGKELISSIVEQVAAAGIRSSDLVKLKVPVPSVLEQREISKILSSIDDKIELNYAINKNLEEIAQALFKRWFVDFEFPNENGEPYKSSGGEFEESELGLIPKGWRIQKINDIAEVKGGKRIPKSHELITIKTDHPYIRIADITNGRISLGNLMYLSEETYNHISRYVINNDDVYISIVGTIGIVGVINRLLNNANLTENMAKITIINTKIINKFYLYLYLDSNQGKHHISSRTVGSTQPKLALTRIRDIPLIIPDENLMKSFTETVNCIYNEYEENEIENIRLEELRNSLLPKLMSGEIRVPIEREYVQTADLPMAAESKEQYSST
ncbi:restriction endonuclease subunit S [Brevibacillus centrosporus]|uniref:restriction endonuclease subunit S n=1 Tax=Brevibacillus centrosporus TaxID=54910 RepID=UPI002E1A1552|nr:restriction endonuclease subunit S [Brevibacillus centrosporus]MED4912113.1 restriction endonuclease subunit S [Brevibacillus centrosporus]